MDPQLDNYLKEFERALGPLDSPDREDALREIESHLADGTASGATPVDLLTGLGNPRALARALVADRIDRRRLELGRILVAYAFVAGSSAASVVIIPLLTLFAVAFAVIALASPFLGVARMLGASYIHIDFGAGTELPAAWSLPFMILLGAACSAIAWASYRGLRFYLQLLAGGYRLAVRPAG